jgi:beta-lactamase class A
MTELNSLQSSVSDIIEGFSGIASVSANNLTTGDVLSINETKILPALSAIKIGIMAELFFQIQEGKFKLTDRVTVQSSDIRGGTGVFRELQTPFEVTIKDLCMMMIVVSDNTCTWMLCTRLGKDAINQRMRSLGMNEFSLNHDLGPNTFQDMQGKDVDAYSECSARDFTKLVTLMANGELVSKQASNEMLDIMGRCQHIEWLGRYLPLDQFPSESGVTPKVKLYNKVGAYLHARCDTGLIKSEKSNYVITVFASYSKDESLLLCPHEGSELIGKVSKVVYDAWG